MKNRDKILVFLSTRSPVLRRDIITTSGVKSNEGVYLRRLIKDGFIVKSGYGEYSITEKGRQRADMIMPKHNTIPMDLCITKPPRYDEIMPTNHITTSDLNMLLAIRKKYSANMEILGAIRRIFE